MLATVSPVEEDKQDDDGLSEAEDGEDVNEAGISLTDEGGAPVTSNSTLEQAIAAAGSIVEDAEGSGKVESEEESGA